MMLRTAILTLLITAANLAAEDEPAVVAGFAKSGLEGISREIERAISRKHLPGAVFWLERGEEVFKRAYGRRSVYPTEEEMGLDTIFDAASLTKVVATTPSILKLIEMGKLGLDDRARKFIPELGGDQNKSEITIRHLLTHSSGLAAGVRRGFEWSGYADGLAQACAEPSLGTAGLDYRYSDLNFILLGEIVRRVSGQGLDAFAKRHVFVPLKMVDTGFHPSPEFRPRVAPTTRMPDKRVLRGVVHDPTSRAMGGVTGHAGLFTTASDLARYARMMLNGGELDGMRVLEAETVALATSVQSPALIPARRGLGWDIDSPYAGLRGKVFPLGSYGHTGWTGTSLWIDPFSKTFVILLSNRNHPTESGRVVTLRRRLGTLAAQAVEGFDFSEVRGALPPQSRELVGGLAAAVEARRGKVRNGIDVLAAGGFTKLQGLKVGLITNHSGLSRDGRTTIDLLSSAKGVKLVSLFSPEHGIRGTADAVVRDGTDRKTGLPVYSLFASDARKPKPAQLDGLDALVFDIQDIGSRFYTYISTMGLCMEAAAESGIKFFVLDRVNPIGGSVVDGPVRVGGETFTAFHKIPVRHGMTVGELAKLFQGERCPDLDLEIVPVEGWSRRMLFGETGLRWVNPSPNIRNFNQALIYPGVGMLEFTNLSVGRGTVAPFELVGAPFIDPGAFATGLRAARLPGLAFVAVRFKPESSVYKGEECGGVRILVTDPDRCAVIDLGITLGTVLARLYPDDWQTANLNKLLAHQPSAAAIVAAKPLAAIRSGWQPELANFLGRREKVLLYKD